MSTQLPLIEQAERSIADTSLAANEAILPTLTARRWAVLIALYDYLNVTKHENATGGELTEWMRRGGLTRDVNGVRPRLSELRDLGLIQWDAPRPCRAYGKPAHPCRPVLPRAAIARARQAQEG